MEIQIENYLSDDDIKDIVKEEVKIIVRNLLSQKIDNFIPKLAKFYTKNEIEILLPDLKESLNTHLQDTIKSIKLSDFMHDSFGWKSQGTKLLNSVLQDNKELIDTKIKEIFKTK